MVPLEAPRSRAARVLTRFHQSARRIPAAFLVLSTHSQNLAWLHVWQSHTNPRHEWAEVSVAVAFRNHCDHGDGQSAEILLQPDVAIDGE